MYQLLELLLLVSRMVTIYEREFLVADITDECILGLDFMDKFGFIINIAGRTLKQGNVEFPLSSEEQAITVRRVTLVSDVVIPPMSEYIAWAQLDSNPKHQQVSMIQPKDETDMDYVITGKSLVIGPRQLVPVRMMNLSDSEKRLC